MAKTVTNEVEFVDFDAKSGYIFDSAKDQIANLIANYNSRGFEVQSITPITSGETEYSDTENQSYGMGFGYTSSLLIVFRKEEDYN